MRAAFAKAKIAQAIRKGRLFVLVDPLVEFSLRLSIRLLPLMGLKRQLLQQRRLASVPVKRHHEAAGPVPEQFYLAFRVLFRVDVSLDKARSLVIPCVSSSKVRHPRVERSRFSLGTLTRTNAKRFSDGIGLILKPTVLSKVFKDVVIRFCPVASASIFGELNPIKHMRKTTNRVSAGVA